MNEMDAVLPRPRPPGPGNLGVGAAPAGTPRKVAGVEVGPRPDQKLRGSVIRSPWLPARCGSSPPPSPAGPAQFLGSGASPPGGGAEPGWGGAEPTPRLRQRLYC